MPLDYHHRGRHVPTQFLMDRVVMVGMGLVCALVALFVTALTVGAFIETWPSFGMTLVTVPAGIVALAFGYIAVRSLKLALAEA
ncbi:MAG: hypothetical protein QM754_01065 [Tepidisphaeraceae bacterium]